MTGKISRARLALAAVAVAIAGCATAPPAPSAASRPKLVVLIAIDGLPERQVVDNRSRFGPDGFNRLLERGAWYAEAHYGHAFTVTAAGHAVMLTGAYPHRTGIIGNEWLDMKTGQAAYCTGDTAFTYIGHKTSKLDGTSPRNLKVETVGDVLRRLDPRSKVIGISGKDRGAILPAGHAGTAYMYHAQTGEFGSTTYYMKEHPRWVEDFNAAKPADRYFGRVWATLLPEAEYAQALPDNQPWYAKGGALPKLMGQGQDKPGPLFYGSLLPSPFGDELTLAFARAAIAGEALGEDDAPDILSVSLSGHDYVNHAWSAESRLSMDHLLQLDRMLGAFFRDLDAKVGPGSYVIALTADHGFMPAPEYSRSLGRDAGKVNLREMVARINAGLAPTFGEGAWIRTVSAMGLVLDRALIAQKNVDAGKLSEEARRLLLAEPTVQAAYTRAELLAGSRAGAPFFEAMRNAWHPDVSADVQFALKPYWMTASSSATTHGSPHPYDTHVPLLLYGPPWVTSGRVDSRVEVADLAPTLARLLGVPPPSASEGRPLPPPR